MRRLETRKSDKPGCFLNPSDHLELHILSTVISPALVSQTVSGVQGKVRTAEEVAEGRLGEEA